MPQKESETMILGMPSPTWKHLLGIQKKNNGKGFYELKYDHILWLAKSSMSIRLVIEAVKSTKKQNSIKVLVPDYFCYETISDIESEYTIIVFPILPISVNSFISSESLYFATYPPIMESVLTAMMSDINPSSSDSGSFK